MQQIMQIRLMVFNWLNSLIDNLSQTFNDSKFKDYKRLFSQLICKYIIYNFSCIRFAYTFVIMLRRYKSTY